jgi:hypothetical protein
MTFRLKKGIAEIQALKTLLYLNSPKVDGRTMRHKLKRQPEKHGKKVTIIFSKGLPSSSN